MVLKSEWRSLYGQEKEPLARLSSFCSRKVIIYADKENHDDWIVSDSGRSRTALYTALARIHNVVGKKWEKPTTIGKECSHGIYIR